MHPDLCEWPQLDAVMGLIRLHAPRLAAVVIDERRPNDAGNETDKRAGTFHLRDDEPPFDEIQEWLCAESQAFVDPGGRHKFVVRGLDGAGQVAFSRVLTCVSTEELPPEPAPPALPIAELVDEPERLDPLMSMPMFNAASQTYVRLLQHADLAVKQQLQVVAQKDKTIADLQAQLRVSLEQVAQIRADAEKQRLVDLKERERSIAAQEKAIEARLTTIGAPAAGGPVSESVKYTIDQGMGMVKQVLAAQFNMSFTEDALTGLMKHPKIAALLPKLPGFLKRPDADQFLDQILAMMETPA